MTPSKAGGGLLGEHLKVSDKIVSRSKRLQPIILALRVNPGVLHSVSLAKYAVVFLKFHSPASVARSRYAVWNLHLFRW
jgi:hypothetical protein